MDMESEEKKEEISLECGERCKVWMNLPEK